MCSSPAAEDLSIQGTLSSNSSDVVRVYMFYVKTTQALLVKLADQNPKQSETHSSTFLQDSDSDSESEIELRSTHASPEETTSDESDGTLVDTSRSSSPTHPLSGEGDLDSTEGHSQLLVGTLPLIKIHLSILKIKAHHEILQLKDLPLAPLIITQVTFQGIRSQIPSLLLRS